MQSQLNSWTASMRQKHELNWIPSLVIYRTDLTKYNHHFPPGTLTDSWDQAQSRAFFSQVFLITAKTFNREWSGVKRAHKRELPFYESEALVMSGLSEARGIGHLGLHGCRGRELLHGIDVITQVLYVFWVCLKVAVSPTFHPQWIILFLRELPQSFPMGPVHNLIVHSLQHE